MHFIWEWNVQMEKSRIPLLESCMEPETLSSWAKKTFLIITKQKAEIEHLTSFKWRTGFLTAPLLMAPLSSDLAFQRSFTGQKNHAKRK